MKIVGIKKQKNKYKIKLDDNSIIETYDEVIIKNNILYKKEIDDNLKIKIDEDNKYYEKYNDIIKYISKKMRSEKQIKEYMNDIEEHTKEKILKKIKETNLINDNIYTKAYIHDRISLSNDGPNKIKKELLNNGIEENIIDNEISKINKEEINAKLEKLIMKKIKNAKYSNRILKQKTIEYFINQGYDKDQIIKIFDSINLDEDKAIKKEYEKLYNKYKTKYNEEQLVYFLKQKLYQKGYQIEKINEIIK